MKRALWAIPLITLSPPAHAFERYIQILSAVSRNAPLLDRELDEVKALDRNLTFSVGITDSAGIAAQANYPQWRYFDPVIDGAIKRGIPKIRLKIGGGPPHHPSWQALAGGMWAESNRPPAGTDNKLWARISEYKQQLIDRAIAKVTAVGLNPKTTLEIEIGTEPGKGGSEGPWKSAHPFKYESKFSDAPEGTWDDEYHRFLSFQAQHIDFRGLPVLSPAFECSNFTAFKNELDSAANPLGAGWRSKVTVWTLNLYATLGGSHKQGFSDALEAFREKGTRALNMMRASSIVGQTPIAIGEMGWTNAKLNRSLTMTDDFVRGQILRACEDVTQNLGFQSVSTYCLVDDEFGLFDKAFRKTAYDAYKSDANGHAAAVEYNYNQLQRRFFNARRQFPHSPRRSHSTLR